MRRLLFVGALALMQVVSWGGLGSAHSGCDFGGVVGGYEIWNGDSHPNQCIFGPGSQKVFGRGDNDQLGGGGGTDALLGATGWDTLTDYNAGGDVDVTCDGNGNDSINVQDGDGQDTTWLVTGDGYTDSVVDNAGDSRLNYPPNQCPAGE